MFLCAPVAFANMQHKTDGSYGNRPFFCTIGSDVRETSFSPKENLPRSVFCFFSSRKENVPLLFFLEEKKQKKINCGAAFLLCSCRFRQRAAQNGRFKCEPSVFLFRAGRAGKHLFTDKSTAPQCLLFLFFKKRNRSPSFLFRRKKRSACTGSAGPQTDGRRHILRCRRSEYHSGYASLLRLVFARVRRACASAFPCKPTTQKKINCGAAFLLCSCRFRQRAAQNGRFKCEPSVSSFHTGRAGKRLFAD